MTLEPPEQNKLQLELACELYKRGNISAVMGAQVAKVDLLTFQEALQQRKIPRQYSVDDLRDDLETLDKLFPA